MLKLDFGLSFNDLYSNEGLKKIDKCWLEFLSNKDSNLYQNLNLLRAAELEDKSLKGKELSNLLIELACVLEEFLSQLFGVSAEVKKVSNQYSSLSVIYNCKRMFVQRTAAKKYSSELGEQIVDIEEKLAGLGLSVLDERAFAEFVEVAKEGGDEYALDLVTKYAAWALKSDAGKKKHKDGILFKAPKKIDIDNLFSDVVNNGGIYSSTDIHNRDGFSLTDKGISKITAYDEASYCIKCHKQQKDSCSHGMKVDDEYKVNGQNVTLAGCPLGQKISEMNLLKSEGSVIGALAMITVDNPLAAATGHRICNDCMKACIFQKQEPVNIPMVESKTLDDVLSLPWGFEIYSLLTRWNPLKLSDYLPVENNGRNVLVVGTGPAGFTASHYLINKGYNVVAIDALKIEPYNPVLSGVDSFGQKIDFSPIHNIHEMVYEDLEDRIPQGFGGVAEYGITVRWDKNKLTVIRLLLERRQHFSLHGGIRFGSNITYDQASKMGFDHICLAMGAGKPNIINMPNALAGGCRMASDFLMALQLSGAAKKTSLANIQIQLPVLVIGGGLTAIDTATESLAYYIRQVEKFAQDYENLGDEIFEGLTDRERDLAYEYIAHAKLLKENPNDKISVIKNLGGVSVVYRKSIQQSPAYRLNHEELELALQEGIQFIENITPKEVVVDEYGDAKLLKHENGELAARTIFIAAGTSPNTVLAEEDPDQFVLDGKYFRALGDDGSVVNPQKVSKPKDVQIITNMGESGASVSFLGDLHPSYAGNVVKAMASAKQGVEVIDKFIRKSKSDKRFVDIDQLFHSEMRTVVQSVKVLAPKIVEVVVKSNMAARNFSPGQFYKFQAYESMAEIVEGKRVAMEGIALTGAWVEKDEGLLSMIVLEMGGSSSLCRYMKEGDPVCLMGPTGEPTEIPSNENVLLLGGGLGNAVLFSIGQAMKQNGCNITYFAGYKHIEDRFKVDEIRSASNNVVWCCDEAEFGGIQENELSFKGNILECIERYAQTSDGAEEMKKIDRVIVIGSDRMMAAVSGAINNSHRHLFGNIKVAIGSINSPMQCMMKEICGQCIARHVDPVTGKESYVYSCKNQDQDLNSVDFAHLNKRLGQNSLMEKTSAKIIKHICAGY